MEAATWALVIATVALVIVTGVYAWLTWSLSKDASRSAEAAVKSAEAAERSAAAAETTALDAVMPVIVPRHVRTQENDDSGGDVVVVHVTNEGERAAHNVRLEVNGWDGGQRPVLSADDDPWEVEVFYLVLADHGSG